MEISAVPQAGSSSPSAACFLPGWPAALLGSWLPLALGALSRVQWNQQGLRTDNPSLSPDSENQ